MSANLTFSEVTAVVGKTTIDALSYSIVFATIMKVLPPLAALISILWIGFQFYHSEPMKAYRQRRKERNGTS